MNIVEEKVAALEAGHDLRAQLADVHYYFARTIMATQLRASVLRNSVGSYVSSHMGFPNSEIAQSMADLSFLQSSDTVLKNISAALLSIDLDLEAKFAQSTRLVAYLNGLNAYNDSCLLSVQMMLALADDPAQWYRPL
ncbi:hypothetical protein K523DRAFT_357602 [Schizophyllum commune Tattone D]|nr:hypothetical protein K523DRAFT_357602 [Schizophyllum commune Tattone D]